jgi:hypothetical protein
LAYSARFFGRNALEQLLGQPIQGKAAHTRLQPRLAELALRDGMVEQQLKRRQYADRPECYRHGNLQTGTSYLRIDSVGYGNRLNTGYSTCGSRGAGSLAITPG